MVGEALKHWFVW